MRMLHTSSLGAGLLPAPPFFKPGPRCHPVWREVSVFLPHFSQAHKPFNSLQLTQGPPAGWRPGPAVNYSPRGATAPRQPWGDQPGIPAVWNMTPSWRASLWRCDVTQQERIEEIVNMVEVEHLPSLVLRAVEGAKGEECDLWFLVQLLTTALGRAVEEAIRWREWYHRAEDGAFIGGDDLEA